jgi:PKD repeat protein
VEYEYWFDADYAGAQSVAMSSNQYEQVMSDIDALALTNGLHTFHIRFKDASGKWSSVLSQFFLKQETTASILPQLEEYEYWFDTDYASKVNTALSGNQYETIASDLDASALSIGLHTLHIRFKDESTKWSSVLSAFFVKNTTNSVLNNEITAYRYWFDENDAAMVNETVLMPEQYVNVTDAISMVTIPKGTHTIHFQFKDAQGMWSSVTNDTIIKNSLPIANFTADATIFCDNGTVNFDNLSIDGDEFLWEFGDGNTSTDSLATHTYSTPGVYTVSLTAIDPLVPIDSTTTITQLIHVYETPNPTITINGNDSICVGTSVVLSTAPVGIYLWSDNSTAPTLDVNAAGTYSVTVYNIDNSACFAVSDEVEIVLMPLPDASYSFSNVNHLVTFTNTSPEADTYLWNFGDGNTSATTNPTHDYQVNGVYDSYLVAYNFCGSDTAYVTIDLSFIGLSEQILTQELKLYPNPTRSNVWIESNQLSSKGLMIEISNEMGAIVQRLEFNDATSKIQIDMEGFMNGVYYVRITNSMGWSAMEKVILNR